MNQLYESLANLLEYPDESWGARLELGRQVVAIESPELAPAFSDFYREIESLNLGALQERYTQTFDLNPVCTLEVGYHLFGENYKRGLFLANLQETEAPFELGQQNQLPDYLPVLLRLIVKLEDKELRDALIAECLLPAIEKMLAALGQSENPYTRLIETIHRALEMLAPEAARTAAADVSAMPELYRISSRAAKKEQRL
ncbi:MAG TPA: nitrate reductase molybdenum cofactor assembly chaperone [Blastocatellia bacterium]|nr:nitrate reductase molybdenum cofactor assembly chaperone [Blastocatellia bacterium]